MGQRGRQGDGLGAAFGQGDRCRRIVGGISRHDRKSAKLVQCQRHIAVQEQLFDAADRRPGNVIATLQPQGVNIGAAGQHRRQIAADRKQIVAGAAVQRIAGAADDRIIAVATEHQVLAGAAIYAVIAVKPRQGVVARIAAQTVIAGCRGDIVIAVKAIGIDYVDIGGIKGQDIGVIRPGDGEIACQRCRQGNCGSAALRQVQRRGCRGRVVAGHQRKSGKLACRQDAGVGVQLFETGQRQAADVIVAFEPQGIDAQTAVQNRRQIAADRQDVVADPAIARIIGADEQKVVAVAAIQRVDPA